MTTESPERDVVIAERPAPGTPRPYAFPSVARAELENALTVLVADLPGRPLVSASMTVPVGAVDEPTSDGGAAVLAARSLTEGTEHYDAVGLTEAAERLGASIHAEAGWDATSIGVDVPSTRLEPALELLAEVLLRPTFPANEVERLRDERLNDLLQAHADPRRRADETFIGTIYAPAAPYHRPAAGTRETVETLDEAAAQRAYHRILDPARATLVISGDLGGQDVVAVARRLFGGWARHDDAAGPATVIDESAASGRLVRVVHRPGSVQTEIRIGHRGLPRRVPDYHAVTLMGAILGGLFNSRLNMQLREAKGYTYGAGAGFEMRRGAGPFTARAAVNTEVTVPAIVDTIAELERMRDTRVTAEELVAARDFLVGVFPLRFETPGAVVAALSGLSVHGLSLDELTDYRARVEAVDIDAVEAAARAHLLVDDADIVLVGDVDAFGSDLEAAGLGRLVIDRDDTGGGPVASESEEAAVAGPTDESDEAGPTAGAEDPSLPGSDEPAAAETDPDDHPAA